MRAFIIRPFGTQKDIDFDAVERDLIAPALEHLRITGRTTLEVLRQGNIRIDMFQRLLTADLVIADLSIHNANVFYELGIRHALRDKRTFLLRANVDKYPFDLQTDRYFVYDKDDPASSLAALIEALRQTRDSEDDDSPVFKLLPGLEQQNRSRFLPVPLDFREEVERAVANRQPGDLELLGSETKGFEWESEGLRVVGRAQFDLQAFEGARVTWEAVREFDSTDLEANTKLATIYQRIDDLPRSDLTIRRALSSRGLIGWDRAEVHALLGRNAKARWRADWARQSPDQWAGQALRSPFLEESLGAYTDAFKEDLNHSYSGVNALALLTIQVELASAWPQVWAERFEEESEAQAELAKRQERAKKLAATVEMSLAATKLRLKGEGKENIWAAIGEADLWCLTTKRPARVASGYRDALANAPDFAVASVRNQLTLYQQLGVLTENVQAALVAMPVAPAGTKEIAKQTERILLFTGHRIDAPGRLAPRFPGDRERAARDKIRETVNDELALSGGGAYGIAGAASGGDILFHEVCAELGIPTKVYLALPRDQFVAASVQDAGPQWVERFNCLYQKLPARVLADSEELPRWLRDKPDYGTWQRNNLWMLHHALACGAGRVTLIALWDGKKGDGPGGTADLIRQAKQRGAKTVILNTKQLFGLEN